MKKLLVALNAKYAHKGPAVWMLREACAREGIAVRVLELEIGRPVHDMLRDILRQEPDIVGFSCAIWNIALVERLTAALRRALPASMILWGGPEVSYDAVSRIKRPIAPDAILAGEGEETLPAMLLRLEKGMPADGPGVVTRTKDGGVAAPVPPEKWVHLYPRGAVAEPHKLHYVETSRGCPFVCRYCLSSVQGGVRAVPAREAAARLLSARDAGAGTVKALDRTFNFDASRAREIWRILMREGGGAVYHFEIAAHLLGEEDILLLGTAPVGLFQFEIGIQTTTAAALDAMGRKQDFSRLSRAVTALRDAGNIHLHLDLIAGLPGDSYADFAQSVDDALALRPHALQLGFLKLLPGSGVRDDFDAMCLPYDPAAPYEAFASDAVSPRELDRLHDVEEALSLYWNSDSFERTKEKWLFSFGKLEAVAASLREEGFFDAPRSLAYRFDALRRALPADVEEDLRYDWLAAGQREYRPWMCPCPDVEALRSVELESALRRRAHVERFGGGRVLFLPGRSPSAL